MERLIWKADFDGFRGRYAPRRRLGVRLRLPDHAQLTTEIGRRGGKVDPGSCARRAIEVVDGVIS